MEFRPGPNCAGSSARIQGVATMKYPRAFLTRLAACALLITLSSCAGTSLNWPSTQPAAPAMTSSGETFPRAQDCLNIKQATPTIFVCNGKVYTANQLRDMREDADKERMASREFHPSRRDIQQLNQSQFQPLNQK
jgi:hypothetical protein